MTINIPGIGEELGVEYTRMTSFGLSSNAEIALDTCIQSTALAQYALVNINEPNVFIKNVEIQVAAELTSSTGLFTIGDTDDVDGYWTDTLIVGTATSAVWANMATTVAYAQGKLYTSSSVIELGNTGAAVSAVGSACLVNLRVTYKRGCDTNLNPSA